MEKLGTIKYYLSSEVDKAVVERIHSRVRSVLTEELVGLDCRDGSVNGMCKTMQYRIAVLAKLVTEEGEENEQMQAILDQLVTSFSNDREFSGEYHARLVLNNGDEEWEIEGQNLEL